MLDHYSRRVVAFSVFRKEPSTEQVCRLLDRAIARSGAPKYMVTDQGVPFRDEFRSWCARRGVKPRFGAVGKYGSIAVIERFIRTLKSEGLRRLPIMPLSLTKMRYELTCFAEWYNGRRPHAALAGATPDEIYFRKNPALDAPRFEPRPRYPVKVELRAPPGAPLRLEVQHFRGREHLPVFELRCAA